jgi:COP9 signalosome complex subunit 2
MSEDEYEYEYNSDGGYDYSDQEEGGGEGGESDEKIEVENAFYEGDDLLGEKRPREAMEKFEKVIAMETARAERGVKIENWRFKALHNLVTIFFDLGNFDAMTARYKDMLQDMPLVTRNECTEAINAVLEMLSAAATGGNGASELSQSSTNNSSSSSSASRNGGGSGSATTGAVMVDMFQITLEALKNANNERLWFNTNLRLAKLYLDMARTQDVENLIAVLKKSCQTPDGRDDTSKGSNLLEVYCLEIQLCTLTHNNARMRLIYPKTTKLNAAVVDPRIMGVIREEGGKMHMMESDWERAYDELYEAFRNFQEAGNTPRAKTCLKYVVLASMLALTSINPFDAREAKVFQEDKEVMAMSDLRKSLEANDLARFERVLQNKQNHICDEPIIMTYIAPLRRRMREQVLLSLTRPYHKATLAFLAQELSLSVAEVEVLIVEMILNGQLSARIDQIKGTVVLGGSRETVTARKMKAIAKWADNLVALHDSIAEKTMF